jgi:hypothetical protein
MMMLIHLTLSTTELKVSIKTQAEWEAKDFQLVLNAKIYDKP